MSVDSCLFRALHRGAGRWRLLDAPSLTCARYGSAVAVLLMLLAGLRHGAAGRRAVGRCLMAVAALYVLAETIGRRSGRPRPFAAQPGVRALLPHGPGRSFPSRHVASAVAMAVIIQPAARRTARTMALLAAALGLSRIRAGLHYPSDVAAGALLGYVVGRALRSG